MQKADSIFFGKIKENKLIIKDSPRWKMLIGFLEGKEVKVTLEPYKERRSKNQNNWYWGVILPMIMESIGASPWEREQVHYDIKRQTLGVIKKGAINIVPSTAHMNTSEFTDFAEKVRRWAAEFLNINIPDPI